MSGLKQIKDTYASPKRQSNESAKRKTPPIALTTTSTSTASTSNASTSATSKTTSKSATRQPTPKLSDKELDELFPTEQDQKFVSPPLQRLTRQIEKKAKSNGSSNGVSNGTKDVSGVATKKERVPSPMWNELHGSQLVDESTFGMMDDVISKSPYATYDAEQKLSEKDRLNARDRIMEDVMKNIDILKKSIATEQTDQYIKDMQDFTFISKYAKSVLLDDDDRASYDVDETEEQTLAKLSEPHRESPSASSSSCEARQSSSSTASSSSSSSCEARQTSSSVTDEKKGKPAAYRKLTFDTPLTVKTGSPHGVPTPTALSQTIVSASMPETPTVPDVSEKLYRRESLQEANARVIRMHKDKYADIVKKEDRPLIRALFRLARLAMNGQFMMGSMRALHFGGNPILEKNARLYNCVATYVDNIFSFQHMVWLLLCGCGVGFSVQNEDIRKLPPLRVTNALLALTPSSSFNHGSSLGNAELEPRERYKFVLEDSIEGWADAIGLVIVSFMDIDWAYIERIITDSLDWASVQSAGKKTIPPAGQSNYMYSSVTQRVREHPVAKYFVSKSGPESAEQRRLLRYLALFKESSGKYVEFDYSKIRPKGAPIRNINGKAPGSAPLKAAIEKIRAILRNAILASYTSHSERVQSEERKAIAVDGPVEIADNFAAKRVADDLKRGRIEGRQLKSIEVYDIVMHSSDAVLSGGVRRSATICIFSHDDADMLGAKTGNWFIENPQRGRSNNSVLILRDKISKDQFKALIDSVKQFGEPGFIFADSTRCLFNPCVEASLYAYDHEANERVDASTRTGFQACNLCEINAKKCTTPEIFSAVCMAAAFISTLQAGYTSFPYLGEVTESIIRREALLGVSMTGMMDNPKIAFDPLLQRGGAHQIRTINEMIAKIIRINPAARTTCIKPAGTVSCVLGTSSGIHPHHAKKYIRRVQCNMLEKPCQMYKETNPYAVEPSVWSASKSDEVVSFTIETREGALTKADVKWKQLLDYVKLTQQNWVTHGRSPMNCVQPYLNHNVSNTITIGADDWSDVADYVYDNRAYFAGISMLGESGDKDYNQAPFQEVLTSEEIVAKYGDAALYSSGVIVHAQEAFGKNLYSACDALLGVGEKFNLEEIVAQIKQIQEMLDSTRKGDDAKAKHQKHDPQFLKDCMEVLHVKFTKCEWVLRAEKFAHNYFGGDVRLMTYCLKDVDANKKYKDIRRNRQPIPWASMKTTAHIVNDEPIACGGKGCELSKL